MAREAMALSSEVERYTAERATAHRATGWRAVRRDWEYYVRVRGERGPLAYVSVLWENPSLLALWAYRYGYWAYVVCPSLWTLPHKVVYKLLFFLVQAINHVALNASADVGDDVWLGPIGNIIIADNSRVEAGCWLHGGNTLGKVEGDPRFPTLGRKVHVGLGTHIVGPVTVPDDSVIGPNSVVVRSLPGEGGVWTGTPVRPFYGAPAHLIPATRTARTVSKVRTARAREMCT